MQSPFVSFAVADDNAIAQRIKAVLLTEQRKQLYRSLIGSFRYSLCHFGIRAGERTATHIFDAGRLTHLHSNMRIITVSTAVPTPVVPRKRLVHSAVISVNKAMYTRGVMALLVKERIKADAFGCGQPTE